MGKSGIPTTHTHTNMHTHSIHHNNVSFTKVPRAIIYHSVEAPLAAITDFSLLG